MAAPAGATHSITATIQSAQVGVALSDWMTLLCICDMGAGINTDAQSFVAGLESDLSDLRLYVDETEVDWHRAEDGLFDQTEGAEKLYVQANLLNISAVADTEVVGYRGCTGGMFEAAKSAVVGADTAQYLEMSEDGTNDREDWTAGALGVSPSASLPRAEATVGYGADQRGTSTYLSRAHDDALLGGAEGFTVMMWMCVTSAPSYAVLASLDFTQGSIGAAYWRLQRYAANNQWQFACHYGGSVGNWTYARGGAIDLNSWHHIAGVYDADGNLAIYYDAVGATGSAAQPIPSATSDGEYIGQYSGGVISQGIFDEFQVVARPLSASEVATYYNMTSDPAAWCVVGAEAALSAYYPATRRPLIYRAGPRMIGGT